LNAREPYVRSNDVAARIAAIDVSPASLLEATPKKSLGPKSWSSQLAINWHVLVDLAHHWIVARKQVSAQLMRHVAPIALARATDMSVETAVNENLYSP
jgi:hypothetical protein